MSQSDTRIGALRVLAGGGLTGKEGFLSQGYFWRVCLDHGAFFPNRQIGSFLVRFS